MTKRRIAAFLVCVTLTPGLAGAQESDSPTPPPTTPRQDEGIRPFLAGEHEAALREIEEAAGRFRSMSRDYDGEMRILVLREVQRRRRFLERSYGKRIEDIDVVQRQRRLEAIEALQRFVGRYPNHPKHTPDAMFRLAELYFEKAQVDNEVMLTQYERDRDLYDRGKIPEEPQEPRVDFAEATKLYSEIIRRFKDFRYRDVAFYMMGYTQYQSGLEREARDSWLALATAYPDSRFAAEAWMRVGEYHFDYGEWKQAEKAYLAAARYEDSKFYDMVLYKLAWTHFQQYNYDAAINGFKRLIAHYYSEGGEGGLGSALKQEAIDYLARSLAEDDWDGDGEKDPGAGVQRALAYLNDGEAYELDILLAYAKSLYELHEPDKYREAAIVYRTLIDRDPLNARNPEFHERLIEVFDLAGDLEGAVRERGQLVALYSRGTEWYRANLGNAQATTRADRLVEEALRVRARSHHALAQNLKVQARSEGNPALLEQARLEYERAAAAYRQYLEAYPHRKESYEIRFLLAEALYWSERYLDAAAVYAEVRDLTGQSEYREVAAFAAIKAVEQHMENLQKAGDLPEKALAMDADEPPEAGETRRGTEIVRATPEQLPEVVTPWVEHSDKYVEMGLAHEGNEDFPVQQSYRIALMYYNFRHYDEARTRFEAILKAWPTKTEATFAVMNIINSYKDENDWANIEKWTELAVTGGYGDPAQQAALRDQIRMFKLGQQFDRAVALYEEKQYVEAAREFERIVDADPQSPVADKALYNAAMAYQDAKHWNSAARVFERIVVEPRFAGSKFREDALFFLAENNRKFFAFDKAITGYMALLRAFPESKRAFYALYKTAELEEMTGNLGRAAELYEQYANDFSERDDAPRSFFRAGLVYEKLDDTRNQIRIWKAFIERFKESRGVDARIVECQLRLAQLNKADNNWRQAKRFYERVIAEFEGRGLESGSPAAAYAAEARFEIIEEIFRRYEKLILKGSLANQGRIIQQKRQLLQELEAAYVGVFAFKAFGWTIAAYFRVGQLYQLFAKMMYDAPDPPGLGDEDMDEYRTLIEDEALKWENVAVERYEVTVQQARALKIVNAWSQRALEALNRYKPQEYPLFRSERRAYDFSPGSGLRSRPQDAIAPIAPPEAPPEGGDQAPDEPRIPGDDVPVPDAAQPPTDPAAPPVEPAVAPAPEPTPSVAPQPASDPDAVPLPEVEDSLDIPVPDDPDTVPDGGAA